MCHYTLEEVPRYREIFCSLSTRPDYELPHSLRFHHLDGRPCTYVFELWMTDSSVLHSDALHVPVLDNLQHWHRFLFQIKSILFQVDCRVDRFHDIGEAEYNTIVSVFRFVREV